MQHAPDPELKQETYDRRYALPPKRLRQAGSDATGLSEHPLCVISHVPATVLDRYFLRYLPSSMVRVDRGEIRPTDALDLPSLSPVGAQYRRCGE